MSANPKPVERTYPDLDEVLQTIISAADDKHAEQIRAYDVRGLVSYADAVVVLSGANDRQVAAIVDHVDATVKKELGLNPRHVEGKSASTWICMDYGDVIVHVFYAPARGYYEVDGIWPEAPERASEFRASVA